MKKAVVFMLVIATFMIKSAMDKKNDELTGMIVSVMEGGSGHQEPQDEGAIPAPDFSVK